MKRKLIVFRLVAIIFALLFISASLEIFFRIRAMKNEGEPFWGFYSSPIKYDEKVGYALVPGARNSDFVISKWGYRSNGNGDDSLKTGGVFCIGGSTTFGTGARDTGTVSSFLERMIGLRVINGGVPGMHAYNWVRRIDGEMEKLKPRVVVVWLGWNIFGSAITHGEKWSSETLMPGGVLMMPPKRGAVGNFFAEIIAYSRLLRELRSFQLNMMNGTNKKTESDPMIENGKKILKDTSIIASAFETQLDSVVQNIRSHGAIPILMTSPFIAPTIVDETEILRSTDYYNKEEKYWFLYREWWGVMNNIIRREAQRTGVPLLDMGEICTHWDNDARKKYFYDMIHMLPEGNSVIAEDLVKKIEVAIKEAE